MSAREHDLASPLFGDDIERLHPVVDQDGSDSAMFDNVLENPSHRRPQLAPRGDDDDSRSRGTSTRP